jgi:hypothetical protein
MRRALKTGKERRFWIVDIMFEHADGRIERVRKIPPVQTRRGAEEYDRQLRDSLLKPTSAARKESPVFASFVNDRWLPTYPIAAGNRHSAHPHPTKSFRFGRPTLSWRC